MIRLISRSCPLIVAVMMFVAFVSSMTSIATEQEADAGIPDLVIERS